MLLQSDYCKSQAADLIQRATTSPWPGTTLNLLKFPILRPSEWRLLLRVHRLQSMNKLIAKDKTLRQMKLIETKDPKNATLIGYLDRTFKPDSPLEKVDDLFTTKSNVPQMGINENAPEYKSSRWCYDTPGVVHPDQVNFFNF